MNEHKARAQARKAALIAEVVWTSMRRLNIGHAVALVGSSCLSELDPAFWTQAAKEAGVNPPSIETVAMVIALIKVREEVEAKHGADPFAGIGA